VGLDRRANDNCGRRLDGPRRALAELTPREHSESGWFTRKTYCHGGSQIRVLAVGSPRPRPRRLVTLAASPTQE
jgi:hypothetical protein